VSDAESLVGCFPVRLGRFQKAPAWFMLLHAAASDVAKLLLRLVGKVKNPIVRRPRSAS
jgi:hypothetical protein